MSHHPRAAHVSSAPVCSVPACPRRRARASCHHNVPTSAAPRGSLSSVPSDGVERWRAEPNTAGSAAAASPTTAAQASVHISTRGGGSHDRGLLDFPAGRKRRERINGGDAAMFSAVTVAYGPPVAPRTRHARGRSLQIYMRHVWGQRAAARATCTAERRPAQGSIGLRAHAAQRGARWRRVRDASAAVCGDTNRVSGWAHAPDCQVTPPSAVRLIVSAEPTQMPCEELRSATSHSVASPCAKGKLRQ